MSTGVASDNSCHDTGGEVLRPVCAVEVDNAKQSSKRTISKHDTP
jgi:hypothetical protein